MELKEIIIYDRFYKYTKEFLINNQVRKLFLLQFDRIRNNEKCLKELEFFIFIYMF